MVETSKQVRVDNWGIYFLQRLQLFFSKTDYCDLTLQFEGNVQLKVHRLVMNACTEYFAFLEQACPALEENTIMMPTDLQADVIVPIVNFMYTGMLEFHPSIYDKLYKAAETMNIAVLTKLLEAQLAPVSRMTSRGRRDKEKDTTAAWKDVKKPTKAPAPVTPPELPPAPAPAPKKVPPWKKTPNTLQSHPVSATFTSKWNTDPIEKDPIAVHNDNTPKPTRFEWPEDDLTPIPAMYPTFDDVSLTSKPLWTKEDDQRAALIEEHHARTAITYPGRRSSRNNSVSQEQDDEFTEKDHKVEDTSSNETSLKRKSESQAPSSPKRIKITNQEEETIISIMTSNPSEVDHTKIVSEILKKYPDLVKKKKNIKLKITQSKSETAQVKLQTVKDKAKPRQLQSPVEKVSQPPHPKEIKREAPTPVKDCPTAWDVASSKKGPRKANFRAASEEGPWTCMECFSQEREGAEFVLYYLFRKHMADQHQVEFDSSLCKYCGKKCVKENYMTYHLYTKHGLKPPRDVAFPKCTYCPFIAVTTERLQDHLKLHGKDEVQCATCQLGFLTKKDLSAHQQISGHSNRVSSILDCAYCLKKLQSPVTLFTHVRGQHLKEARRDGVTSLDEFMDVKGDDTDEDVSGKPERPTAEHGGKPVDDVLESGMDEKQLLRERVKIISNVKVDGVEENCVNKETERPVVLPGPEPQTVAVTTTATALSNIGSGLATNLGLVDIVVLDDNQQYILQQPQGQPGNAEFILPPELTGGEGILQAAAAAGGELNSTDELVMVLTDHDYQDDQHQGQSDNSNIVVLYSHPVEGQQGQFITSQGNLLVNSEGLLEIRNGAAITTTAGQILVNSGSGTTITTTQATDSPGESLDLIRKEIEGVDDVERVRESVGGVESSQDKVSNNVPPEAAQMNGTEPTEDDNLDKDLPTPLDAVANNTIQKEDPTDGDQLEHPTSEASEIMGQDENDTSHIAAENKEPENSEAQSDEIYMPDETPAETSTACQEHSDQERSDHMPASQSENEAAAAAVNDFQTSAELQEPEPMEVDDAQKRGEVPDLDGAPPSVEQLPPDAEQTPEVIPPSPPPPHKEQNDDDANNESQRDQVTPSKEDDCSNSNHDTRVNEDLHQDVPTENGQEESGPPPVEINDSNVQTPDDNNVQTPYEEFTTTDESQQSSAQKTRNDVNKEILDDWEDTDSQQSQSRETDGQENGEDQASLNAAENVNKLMDDWDEEDEDQTK